MGLHGLTLAVECIVGCAVKFGAGGGIATAKLAQNWGADEALGETCRLHGCQLLCGVVLLKLRFLFDPMKLTDSDDAWRRHGPWWARCEGAPTFGQPRVVADFMNAMLAACDQRLRVSTCLLRSPMD